MDKLQIALIGCGTWGMRHAALYHEDPRVEITGVCDMNIDRALAAAEKYGLAPSAAFSDYKEMLEAVACDAVAIVTPDFAHREPAVFAANLGKHMIIEKPLATNQDDLDAMYEAITKNNVRAMVDFHNRFNPPFALMKEQIDEGAIGEPYSAYLRLNDQKWVATDMLPWAAKSSILWFLGSHAVDTLRWLFGSEVESVYSVSRSGLLKKAGVDTVDIYQYTLRFANGAIAQVENGWITPDTYSNVNDYKCSVLGVEGMFSLDLSEHNLIRRYSASGASVPDILVNNFVRQSANGFAYQSIKSFINCLISGEEFDVSLQDAYNTSRTIFKIFESDALGAPVKVDGLLPVK